LFWQTEKQRREKSSNQHVIVESARSEGDLLGLLVERVDDLRVAVPLIDSRVGRQEVQVPDDNGGSSTPKAFTAKLGTVNVEKVPSPFYIPDMDALSTGEYNRDRVVVVGTIALRCRSISRAQEVAKRDSHPKRTSSTAI
jgi:hypothetical protein